MADGVVKGLFVLGQNPVVGAVNTELVQRGMAKLDWMVVRDFAMTETASSGNRARSSSSGEMRPEDIGTEVFFLPSAMAAEKDGTITNTNRLVQWHDKVCEPAGRLPLRPMVPLPSRPAAQGPVRDQQGAEGRADSSR